MSATHLRLAALAVWPTLPGVAAAHLAAVGDPRVRRLLARRADLPEHVRAQLAVDVDRTVRRHAIARLTDPAHIEELSGSTSPTVRSGLAANPCTPPEMLDAFALLDSFESPSSPARAALANPATSTDAVLERVQATAVGKILPSASDAGRAMESTRILTAHPEVASLWVAASDGAVVRSVARRADITRDVAARVGGRRDQVGKKALAMNPFVPDDIVPCHLDRTRARLWAVLDDRDPREACSDPTRHGAIAATGSPTLDLLLVEQVAAGGAALDGAVIEVLYGRRTPCVEPDVVAGILATSDLDAAKYAVSQLASTRMRAVAAVAPTAELALDSKDPVVTPSAQVCASVCEQLGDDPDRWYAFAQVAKASRGPLDDLAAVAAGIAA